MESWKFVQQPWTTQWCGNGGMEWRRLPRPYMHYLCGTLWICREVHWRERFLVFSRRWRIWIVIQKPLHKVAIFHGIHVSGLYNQVNKCLTTKSKKFMFLYCYAICTTILHQKQVFSCEDQFKSALKYLNNAASYIDSLKQDSVNKDLKVTISKTIKVLERHQKQHFGDSKWIVPSYVVHCF